MLRAYRAPLLVVAAALLAGCSTNPQSACSQPPVQSYPSVHMVAPASGSTNVQPNIGQIVVTTHGAQLYGTLTLTGPDGTITLHPAPMANSSGDGLEFAANVPALQTTSSYSVRYTLQYPGGCQGPVVTNTQSVGAFTTT